MFCQKCGTNLPENSEFCSNCGNKIERPVVTQIIKKKLDKNQY